MKLPTDTIFEEDEDEEDNAYKIKEEMFAAYAAKIERD